MQFAASYRDAWSMAHILPSHPSAWNQQVYQRLKLAFELGLKHQIFVAVCDDWTQTDALAARLQSEIGPHLSRGPGLVSLNLQLNHPDPIAQIRRWLQRRSPPLSTSASRVHPLLTSVAHDPEHHHASNYDRSALTTPGFQILGVETLIRQSAAVQWSFLGHLRRLPEHLSELDSSILFWMSRPWRYTIARSTPEFWRCCSGIFEFTGEPIPRRISAVPMVRDRVYAPEMHEASASPKTSDPAIKPPLAPDPLHVTPWTEPPDTTVPETDHPAAERFDLSFSELSQAIEPILVANVQETRHLVVSTEVDPQQVLVHLFELKRTHADSATLATTYQCLGSIYRDRLDSERPDLRCVMIAIQAYECALACWHQSEHVEDTRDRQLPVLANDIGTLYWMMADCVETTDDRILSLQRGEAAYRYTLERLSEIEQPYAWASIQDNLGSLCSDLARMATATALQIKTWKDAIASDRAALRYQLPELDPQQFATIHSNLGTACWNLAQITEPVIYLEQAIQAYRTALEFFTAERDPWSYAMLQTNLGTAAWNLSRYDRQRDRLQFAIRCYRSALVYRTAENHPTGYAATQNNLGTAYWNLAETFDIRQEREALITSLRDSISAYEQAIMVASQVHDRTDLTLSFDLHATYDNLGMAYAYLGTCLSRTDDAPERLCCYEQAVACYVRAIEGYGSDDPRYDSILNELTTTLRSLHDREGLNAQNHVFSSMPAPIIADVMRRL
ncbi:MAG: tetratricopeptide repeat protein [Coleofasciculaceae cyanobacterium RL_1_1]|nr:tetratricopeptide repeat protein [Coleofasciculaceae cyanobacterium RL_1_1]